MIQGDFNMQANVGINKGSQIQALMLVAGDDDQAKPTVLKLVEDVGFEAVDFGGLEGARLLEPFALTWIKLAYQHGLGRDFAFGLLRG